MKRGFYTIMAAQFFSSLADNAIFVAAVGILKSSNAKEGDWQAAALVPMFAFFYVILAPFLGAFADAHPKGRVMFISNFIKVAGCVLLLFGVHPLLAYAVVGLGAAAYSPAKYGILTELLPPSQLVRANGWIEGLTIASIILGTVLGGTLISEKVSSMLLALDMPWIDSGVDTPGEAAVLTLMLVYCLAAWFNLRIPRTNAPLQPFRKNPEKGIVHNLVGLLPDFWDCNVRLWRDKLGQISLSTTTLFWGVSGNLRYIVLVWSAAALGYSTSQGSNLLGVVAIGTAAGAVLASVRVRLDQATSVMPLGIAMGLLVILMNFIDTVWLAIPFLVILGGLGGFMVVPMNALLQHRGHSLMGAGRSIAVQNFNEQACILLMGAMYSLSTRYGMSAFGAITGFGLVVAGVMALITLWHKDNCRRHPQQLAALLQQARHEKHH